MTLIGLISTSYQLILIRKWIGGDSPFYLMVQYNPYLTRPLVFKDEYLEEEDVNRDSDENTLIRTLLCTDFSSGDDSRLKYT